MGWVQDPFRIHCVRNENIRCNGRKLGTSQLNNAVAAAAPTNCAAMKPGTSAGRMPLKVSLAALARVAAGLANDVDAVNQYAAVMYTPTAMGHAADQ
jgi:hypothetical protein